MKTARAYGFGNTGTTIASSLNEAIEILINTGKIEETDGKLNIKE